MIERQLEAISSTSTQAKADARTSTSSPAQRALAEAEARRIARQEPELDRPLEINGRQGPEPVRYGDWENKGIATDF